MKIQIVLFDGFGELVSFAPFEVLNRAIEEGAPFTVEFVSSEPKQEVTTSFGVTVKLHDFLRMDNRPDLLIVPGGGWNHKAEHGARKQAELGTLTKIIREMHNEGTIVAGVCTGGMLLAASGILNDKKATMHHLAQSEIRTYGAEPLPYRIVDQGNVITARGVTSGLDLGLWITERFASPKIAAAVEYRMEYERRGVVWK
ncbi:MULTISPECIES: DJ-1/PfpI family protein [Bacillus]|uniref:DJ-1/PfpI family protein n=1 Tax=Bacillus TaxID=1386 RepID=UPI00032EA205|nr:DJ-1/PfpI family protein [Bacillus wiedmannii]EOP11997.1 AraC family transcriptional regulator [Bacillus cereus BAG2O-3]EOQ10779.1 AraC family transcriptional regulator [Bacillus cereus B5-2]EOQ28796.1 AraC family transcriptional regulator [Bacillus cereus BAG3O-1]PEW24593.1 AraC family transcriptional regulator [Bacillus cereus]PFW86135.1 AraC family transcriptional regulator [Bacillus sp. AFS075960]RFB46196.1 DJ-1/PfpI family protein [Bacillus sp. dmp10]RFB69279.1 DJ-1/PfpI family prote